MNLKRVLITGSEGNIGTELQKRLPSPAYSLLRCDIVHKYAKNYIISDITNPIDLYPIATEFRPHVAIHLAAKVSRVDCEKSPSLTVNTNLHGLMNIIKLCLITKAKLIYFSTSEVYGNIGYPLSEDSDRLKPNNIYGLTKLKGEELVKYYADNYGLKAVILRPFMIYNELQAGGEDKCALNRIVHSIKNGKRFNLHKNSTRSWLHISDFCNAVIKSVYVDIFETFNIGHPDIYKTSEVAQMVCDKMGVDYAEHILEVEQPKGMTLLKEPDLRKQKEVLGFVPEVNIEEGIDLLIDKVQ